MTYHKPILILNILILGVFNVFSQSEPVLRTVPAKESVNLNLLWYTINHGTIFWEKSTDGFLWEEIEGEHLKNYIFPALSDFYYRARIESGTCDPVYSRSTRLTVMNFSIDSLGEIGQDFAQIYLSSYLDTTDYPEKGIFLEKNSVPGVNSKRYADSTGQTLLTISLQNLEKGTHYFARAYVKNSEGTLFTGNIVDFYTTDIQFTGRQNIYQTTAELLYKITSSLPPVESGVIFSTDPDLGPESVKVPGNLTNHEGRCLLPDLNPGSFYYAQPYMVIMGKTYYGTSRKIRTFSNYSQYEVDTIQAAVAHKIAWKDPSTAIRISQSGYFGDYGRIKRAGNTDTLILVYQGGPENNDWVNICMRLSYNNGATWSEQVILKNINDFSSTYWRFCTPELLVMKNGTVILAYEANVKEDENKSEIHILISRDTCKSFEDPIILICGRSWEPAMIELPGGEIELFYSSEEKWWPGDPIYQEIIRIASTDGGYNWSEPVTVAYYPEKRDGMPVPLLLKGNRGVVFAIESVNSALSPYIIKRDLNADWNLTTSGFYNSPYRWVVNNFSGHGGAPYLLQLPTGEVLLSAHIYRGGDWHQNNYMQTMVGDNNARNFSYIANPWGYLPENQSSVNNSLFLLDNETVVAVSCRMFPDKMGGIYWLEGKIVPVE